jgi:molybdopterin synthase sulfur carrier subunit
MHIRAYATLRDLLGGGKFDMPLDATSGASATVGQVMNQLVEAHPALAAKLWAADGHLTGYVTILLNGRSVEYLQGMATPVANGDTLSLFPPVGGG